MNAGSKVKAMLEARMRLSNKTCVAILTPAGRGAVATIAVRGPQAVGLVEKSFIPAGKQPFSEQSLRRLCYGKWQHATGEEDVVACRFEDRVEVHSHGGHFAPRAILNALVAAGATPLEWQDWLTLNAPTPLAAITAIALAEARTPRANTILQIQQAGALHDKLQRIAGLLDTYIESGCDKSSRVFNELDTRVAHLWQTARWGLHLNNPWRVVIAGPPNAGKSSLLNALVGYQRSIVFDQPGTTRDVVVAQTAHRGWLLEFRDTAGMRTSSDELEVAGMALAQQELQTCDSIVLVFDAAAPWEAAQQELVASFPTAIVVHNKVDLPREQEWQHARPAGINTIATQQTGIAELLDRIVLSFAPEKIEPNRAVLFDNQIAELIGALQSGLHSDAQNLAHIANHLRMLMHGAEM